MTYKLALVIPTLDQGGAEKQLCLLADGLSKELFDVQVIALTRTGPREASLRDSNIPIHQIHKHRKFDPLAWRRLYRLLREMRPDIVHTWLFAANAYGRSAALAAGVPVIAASERSVDPWKAGWQLRIDRWLAKKTGRITTNSNGVVNFYKDHGISESFFSLIPNAVPERVRSAVGREEIASRLGIPVDKKWILSVGRLWPQKGYKDLIWAAEMVRVLREDTCYIIIGDGPERERLELYRDNIRGASQLHFAGERSDVAEILPHASVLWNGSLYEGQSNVILEAMQAGVPVVASDIPGNRDLVKDRETGFLFPLGNVDLLMRVTHELLSSKELAQQISSKAQEFVRREHSLEAMIRRHETIYLRWMNENK